MKRGFLKVISLLLALSLSFGVLSGCSKEEDVNVDAIVNAAVDAALEKTVVPFTVTIDADGKLIYTVSICTGCHCVWIACLNGIPRCGFGRHIVRFPGFRM